MNHSAEAGLIARCRRGDPDAWNELFDAHYAAVGRFVFQLSQDFTHEDAEEICQEVFLSVVKNLRSFNGRCRLQTWIFRIALNKTRDFLERQRAAKRGAGVAPLSLQAEDPETGATIDPPGNALAPDDYLLQAETHARVRRAVGRLSDAYREVIELRYFGELSYEEIARELDITPQTVSSRLSKSLDRLAVILRHSELNAPAERCV